MATAHHRSLKVLLASNEEFAKQPDKFLKRATPRPVRPDAASRKAIVE
jgi:hypothetical protein